jgi:peptidoglycan hydrolase-like protein with peptidoglycan-binding domain
VIVPLQGDTVSNRVTIQATASSPIGIAGVQFLLDGVAFGPEIATLPYQIYWNTVQSPNGTHILSVIARDTANNTARAGNVTVVVSNIIGTPPSLSPPPPAATITPHVSQQIIATTTTTTPPTPQPSTQSLQDQITFLTATLQALILKAQQLGISPYAPTPIPVGDTALFPRNLSYGMKGDDVKQLQIFLIQQNRGPVAQQLGAVGAKRYFGWLTKQALKEFQKAAGIVPATGFFGSTTRAYVRAMIKN